MYKKVTQWKQKKDAKKKTIELPEAVEVSLELWDSLYEKKRSYRFVIPLFGSLTMQEQKEKKKPEPKSAPAPTPSAPAKIEVSFGPPQLPPPPSIQNPEPAPASKVAHNGPAQTAYAKLYKKISKGGKKERDPQDMSWLERVTIDKDATLTVNGVEYVPTS